MDLSELRDRIVELSRSMRPERIFALLVSEGYDEGDVEAVMATIVS